MDSNDRFFANEILEDEKPSNHYIERFNEVKTARESSRENVRSRIDEPNIDNEPGKIMKFILSNFTS